MKRMICLLSVLLLLAGCETARETAAQAPSVSPPTQSSSSPPPAPSVEPAEALETSPPSSSLASWAAGASKAADLPPEAPLTVKLAVPEGYTLAKIGLVLEEKGVCTAQALLDAAAGDFSDYPLIAAQKADAGRCFALEGYLFPATYEIYASESPEAILRRLLTHTEQTLTPALRKQIDASGYTVHEILTLASIIEKESFGAAEMPNVSSVLHNRLANGMRLQCDVTIKYVEGAVKPFISGDVNRYNNSYNTYKCDGLPAGPICNPGLPAIQAALSPADTPYFYFLTDADQNYLYAETFEQHQENIKEAGI